MRYWLFKSEPDVFGIDDLMRRPRRTEAWDGVRNYQARNMLRDEISKGDLGFFYHSSCAEPGIVGTVSIARGGYPDPTAWDPESKYYDPKSSPDNPRWYQVDVRFKKKFKRVLSLAELKAEPMLNDMALTRRGNRLSVMPVTEEEWQVINALA